MEFPPQEWNLGLTPLIIENSTLYYLLNLFQTWHFGTYRRRVYLGWNYNTFRSHRDRAGTEGVIEITLETG